MSRICEALGVSRSGFHAWLVRAPSARARSDEEFGASSYAGTGTSIVMKAGRGMNVRAAAQVANAAKSAPNRLKPSF